MTQDNLTAKQNDYALFLPALSSFYATFVGKQRHDPNYVEPARMPQAIQDMEMLNWLDPQKGLFPYKWSLYSAGHADLDLTRSSPKEDMVRNRDPGSFILGDSGGFQIAKGLWEGDWKANSGCPKAQKKREAVLKWMDGIADYGMILDIPTWVVHHKEWAAKIGINTYEDAVDATKFNNDYFMKHRKGAKNGGAKFLNVLQGSNHAEADKWYNIMKVYCDPKVYPDTHFDGWAMGAQNMSDVHLALKRLVHLRHDGLLQEGIHDWIHFLGMSKLEWALLLTDIQRAIRKYVNPSLTISFDCASPFLATANGQVYYEIDTKHNEKWSYRMSSLVDDKKYSTDTRNFADVIVQDGIKPFIERGPILDRLQIKDVCYYKPGDLNKIGKEGRTSWDSFSYALLMGHNVWMHIESVQRANREYDQGTHPKMLWNERGDHAKFRDIVERIFATPDKQEALDIIEQYDRYWMDIVGTRGFKGKKSKNATTMFNALFDAVEDEVQYEDDELDDTNLEKLEDENDTGTLQSPN
jgi:hypothetical protein